MLSSKIVSLALIPMMAVAAPAVPGGAEEFRVYIGTGADHVYLMQLSTSSGALRLAGEATEAQRPGFLALHPRVPVLYSVESVDGGSICAYRIDEDTGRLSLINRRSSKGNGPCHVAVSPECSIVAVANYGSGSIATVPIDDAGVLGKGGGFAQHEGHSVNPQRQEGPHAHSVTFHPDGGLLLAADLGTDKVYRYRYSGERDALTPHDQAYVELAPGSGPRHVAFHPSARYVYVVNELGNTVTVFECHGAEGAMKSIQTVGTLPEDFTGDNTTAEIRVHPSGRYVYASNRGHDSIAAFSLDAETGKLAPLGQTPCGGAIPRNFNIDPTGRYLLVANQESDNVAVLEIDPNQGTLSLTDVRVNVPKPMCVLFRATSAPPR